MKNCPDYYKQELSRRDYLIKRLVEDGERLASTYVVEVFPHEWVCRGGCHHGARFGEQIDHTPDCPITLHRALMKELNRKGFETTMKRVLDENIGAWKALADGEEGKGSQLTESHRK